MQIAWLSMKQYCCYRQEAHLEDRVTTVGGNAMQQWPDVGADVVLMSYLLSALHKNDTQLMLRKAWDALPPGSTSYAYNY